jgi:galactose mutarotase-like enzyme
VGSAASVAEERFRGQPAITLAAGDLSATFLPGLGMTGVSMRCNGREHLALPGGLAALRRGSTLGLPLLAPWANRLSEWRYRVADVEVDLTGLPLGTDGNGLPIHGVLVGQPGWRVERCTTRGGRALVHAAIDLDHPAFPFPHRVEVTATAGERRLTVDTTIVPTGTRAVPVAFGWHPYLRLPGTPRSRWHLRLPDRTHVTLDDRGIPTGAEAPEGREADPIGRRTFDDLYVLGDDRHLALESEDCAVSMRPGDGYQFAQVWVPPGRPFAALEPMTTRTNSLVDGTAPLVAPGDASTATFTLAVEDPPSVIGSRR